MAVTVAQPLNPESVPQQNVEVVDAPFALIEPFIVADVVDTEVAAFVVTVGVPAETVNVPLVFVEGVLL